MVHTKEAVTSVKPTVKRLTPEQVEYRRKGLCFKCSIKNLIMIEIDYPEDEEEEILFEPKEKSGKKDAEISIHVMEGDNSSQTIRLMGHINNKPVSIPLDGFHI